MTQRNNSAQDTQVVSDERIRNKLRTQIHRAIHVDKRFSRTSLSEESGVNVYAIDAILSDDKGKHRRVAAEDMLSLAYTLGGNTLNILLGLIGFGGAKPLDEPDEMHPMMIAATTLAHLSTITTAAADGRIDHTEEQAVEIAADGIIATLLPLSSSGKRA